MIELNYKQEKIDTTNDNIVIQKYVAGLPGGVELDVTEYNKDLATLRTQFTGNEDLFKDNFVPAGTLVVKKNGSYKPAKLSYNSGTSKYGFSFGAEETPIGFTVATINATREGAGILVDGIVNLNSHAFANGKVFAVHDSEFTVSNQEALFKYLPKITFID